MRIYCKGVGIPLADALDVILWGGVSGKRCRVVVGPIIIKITTDITVDSLQSRKESDYIIFKKVHSLCLGF